MEIRTVQRRKAKIKLGLRGPSGSGKTYKNTAMNNTAVKLKTQLSKAQEGTNAIAKRL